MAAVIFFMPALAAASTVPTKLKIGLILSDDVAPIFVGIRKGFFAAEGLEIEVVPSTGGAIGIPALIGGALDITYGNSVSALLAAQQNLDIKIIAVTLSRAPDFTSIIGRKADSIKTGADLAGKTLAVNTRNGVIWLFARAWISATGGDPAKVLFKEVPFPQMSDALLQKQIDVAFNLEPFRTRMLNNPDLEEIAKPYKVVQPGVQVATYIASGALLAKDKGAVDRFLRALAAANAWFDSNLQSDELVDIVAAYSGATREQVKASPKRPSIGKIDPAEIAKTMALMREHGMLKADVDLGRLIYTQGTN